VENAVKHGIASIIGPGLVEIRIEAMDERLHIAVGDNGPGFKKTRAARNQSSQNNFGLTNIEERLRRYFGDAARLHIGRDEDRGMTWARIEMPRLTQAVGGPG
jgi:sensor histidine kinase YesM